MKTTNYLIAFLLLFSITTVNAQTKNDLERQKNKVEIYTHDEIDNLQVWFYDKVDEMKLSERDREEYYSIVLYHTVKMARLDDKDKALSEDEQKFELKMLMYKLNKEVKTMLTEEQYKIHKKSIQDIENSVYAKRGWKKNKN